MVPDVEFFINVGDWPLETRTTDVLPVLSWCGSTDTLDIVLPTYDVTHSTLETMRGVTNDLLSVQGNTGLCLSLFLFFDLFTFILQVCSCFLIFFVVL